MRPCGLLVARIPWMTPWRAVSRALSISTTSAAMGRISPADVTMLCKTNLQSCGFMDEAKSDFADGGDFSVDFKAGREYRSIVAFRRLDQDGADGSAGLGTVGSDGIK